MRVVWRLAYNPFGMIMRARSYESDKYRNGFNGTEKDDEIGGVGNSNYTFFRQSDPRLCRWFSLDPVTNSSVSPYMQMEGNPITFADPLGDKVKFKKGARRGIKQAAKANKEYADLLKYLKSLPDLYTFIGKKGEKISGDALARAKEISEKKTNKERQQMDDKPDGKGNNIEIFVDPAKVMVSIVESIVNDQTISGKQENGKGTTDKIVKYLQTNISKDDLEGYNISRTDHDPQQTLTVDDRVVSRGGLFTRSNQITLQGFTSPDQLNKNNDYYIRKEIIPASQFNLDGYFGVYYSIKAMSLPFVVYAPYNIFGHRRLNSAMKQVIRNYDMSNMHLEIRSKQDEEK